jgi:hypothetical protein
MQNLPSGAQALHPSRQEALQREYPIRDDPPGRMRREPAANVWCRMRCPFHSGGAEPWSVVRPLPPLAPNVHCEIGVRCPMRRLYTVCLTFALLGTLAFAAKKYPMTAASIVPGARAEVEISKDKNGNTRLTIKVQHLATRIRICRLVAGARRKR